MNRYQWLAAGAYIAIAMVVCAYAFTHHADIEPDRSASPYCPCCKQPIRRDAQ